MHVTNGFTLLIYIYYMELQQYAVVDSSYSLADDKFEIIDSLKQQQQLLSSSSSSLASSSSSSLPPLFDFGMPQNISTRPGQTAALTCRVDQLGDKSVSWIRKRDLHILTAGILTYTSDDRFQVVKNVNSIDWILFIKFAQFRDAGIYECQVNTEPKIHMAFQLNVIASLPDKPKASIIGPTDLYVNAGSAITLTCKIDQPSAENMGPIYWLRNSYKIIPFDIHPNDVIIDFSRRISMDSQLGDIFKSRLRISNAAASDSGNYTCQPTTANGASVMVHVINGEIPVAMQKGSNSNQITISKWLLKFTYFIIKIHYL